MNRELLVPKFSIVDGKNAQKRVCPVKSDFGVFIADSPTAHSNAGPLTG
jgi:hypothetical protein